MTGDVLLQVGERSLDQVGIEMTASAPSYFLRSNLERNRSVVWSFVDHRVNGIDYGKNARTKWNVLPGNSAGVAAAVEFFVVGMHQLRRILQEFDATEEFIAISRMFSHRGPFLFVQARGFPKDAVRDFEFADVME